MKGKVILVTGGSGSLGTALLPQLLEQEPKQVRILSNNEYEIYQVMDKIKDIRIRPFIGDVRDKDRMMRATDNVDYIIHTAAMKHINLCAYNPVEAIKTNILGSSNVIDCAIDNNVEKVIAISTDKAVNPVGIYGATKLIMERLFSQEWVPARTKLACCRFGNFIRSRGSFFEVIDRKMEAGEPITITDVDMKRYWISLEDAATFTIKCLGMMEGREIFIPKMERKRIVEFIQDSYPIDIIGKRAGERVEEDLFSDVESPEDKGEYYLIR